jgi:UDP-4-amino-4,6-dideoxy-N-acetyl-beta-L-altrosamine transaminase
MKIIPYGRQSIDREDITEITKVLRSDWITQGPKIKEFEEALCQYIGTKYAVVVSSGTAALHLACLAIGLKKGDEAITTPITFVATANSIIYSGAEPKFAEIDYKTVNIDPQQIRKKITKKTKAILPVHFAGLACDMEEINKIARDNHLIVIEDAAHALGAEYKNSKVGSCKYSDLAIFSFHPVKHITTGEGGAITTNNKKLYEKLIALRSHGIYKNKNMTKKYGLWYYEMRELGFNYRMNDIQCALGISQLRKIDSFIERRKEIANIYNKALAEIANVELQDVPENRKHSYHLYLLKIDFNKLGISRQSFTNRLRRIGIQTQVHYIPVYRQPYYRSRCNISFSSFPKSEKYYQQALSIPIYPLMSNKDVIYVSRAIKEALG